MGAGLNRLDYWWRLVATAYNFATFGIGGVLTALLIMPGVRLLPGSPQRRDARARQVVHYLFRGFVRQLRATGVMSLSVDDPQRLREASAGRLVVVNHPTLIDVVVVMALLPYSCCVVKSTLWRNPLLAGVIRAAGYISNADPSQDFMGRSERVLRAGYPIVVFPEGTRTVAGRALSFQRGAANIAVRRGIEVLPVVVRCEPPTLRKHEPWYRIPARRPHVSVVAHAPVPVHRVTDPQAGPARATRQFNRYLEDFYKGELQHE
jgi:1-acyl-sn-glycerol-3-phosphate acyltransferase